MCGSWKKIVVDQRRCRRILKQLKQCVLPIFAFFRLNTRKSRVKAQKGKNGQNALFHLLQNAPTPALIYHDFLPTSTHAHNYRRIFGSLHPNEQVYMHFNIKRVKKSFKAIFAFLRLNTTFSTLLMLKMHVDLFIGL